MFSLQFVSQSTGHGFLVLALGISLLVTQDVVGGNGLSSVSFHRARSIALSWLPANVSRRFLVSEVRFLWFLHRSRVARPFIKLLHLGFQMLLS